MPLLEKEVALRELAGVLPRLDDVMRSAWREWQSVRLGRPYGKRVRASIVYDETVELARVRLPEAREVVVNEQRIFLVKDQFAIRFKKLDGNLSSSNVRTRQNTLFRRQEALDGLPPLYNLEAGYVLNHLETDIVSTHLVCPSGLYSHAWQLSLDAESLGIPSATLLPFRNPLQPPSTQEGSVRFRRKPAEHETKDHSDEGGV